MLTKINKSKEKVNDLVTNHSFSIPENIQNIISERWFYLYNWISEKDVKNSIQRDFLKLIKKFWPYVSAVFITIVAWFMTTWNSELWNIFLYWWIWIINFFLLIYLTIIAITRSKNLRENDYVLMTDSSISINWKIEKYEDFFKNSRKEIIKISNIFEEEIFKESNLEKTKKTFLSQVFSQIWDWFRFISKLWKSSSKDSVKVIGLLLVIYCIYALSLWIFYIVWIFLIWCFWILLSIINKQIMLVKWHKITSINELFEKIDKRSMWLVEEKTKLSKYLNEALNNDWKDSLLIKINNWIKEINSNAESAINSSIKLKKEIIESKYSEMFNFWIYNSWIKKQIYTPLSQIVQLLEKNIELLKKQVEFIKIQIKNTTDISLIWPLELSKKRIEEKKIQFEKQLPKINNLISNLK